MGKLGEYQRKRRSTGRRSRPRRARILAGKVQDKPSPGRQTTRLPKPKPTLEVRPGAEHAIRSWFRSTGQRGCITIPGRACPDLAGDGFGSPPDGSGVRSKRRLRWYFSGLPMGRILSYAVVSVAGLPLRLSVTDGYSFCKMSITGHGSILLLARWAANLRDSCAIPRLFTEGVFKWLRLSGKATLPLA